MIVLNQIINFLSSISKRGPRDPESTPWLDNKTWVSRKIPSEFGNDLWGMVFFCLVWNGITWPLLYTVIQERTFEKEPWWAMLVAAIFPMIGLVAALYLLKLLWHRYKYGRSIFELETLPGEIGGKLEGNILIPKDFRPEDGFVVRLRCVNRIVTGGGKNRRVDYHDLWKEERKLHGHRQPRQQVTTCVPVKFSIPDSCRETDERYSRNQILWWVEISADVSGIDYNTKFTVPVFLLRQPPAHT